MSTQTKIFLTGATGYIGGAILARLLARDDAAAFKVTALVRNKAKADKLKSFGVHPVIGSLADLDIVEKQAAAADVVIATADCDDLDGAKATLRGLKKRYESTGTAPIFINTSGTGVLIDNAGGMHKGDVIYDDSNVEQIESLAPSQPHRPVDLAITAADNEGYAKTYIILPSTIYGIATGPLVDAGIQNPYSIQIPSLIKAALDRGRAGMVGAGKAVWPHVHIDELSDLYMLVFDGALAGTIGHGRDGFYFGASGEYSWLELAQAIGKATVAVGRASDPEPVTFTDEEVIKYFGSPYLGTNSRCVAKHSKSIGWRPVKTTADMLATIEAETRAFLQKQS
ncbi:NAD(P)-binding protein [Fistulina hepatica ATCC 64428]|nr:NAD(P)-binding protein [Fistulina hepatica ATCC 64428]